MSFRRSVATCAIAVAVLSSVSQVAAQGARGGGGGFGGGPPLYTPDPGARDMKATLFNWTWSMGMLRGQAEPELIGTLDYHGEGTVRVDGQNCTITKFRLQANYQIPGFRSQIECTRPNGQTYSNVETISGQYVWDEDRPGAEIVAGEGKATPRPRAYEERVIRLWASPHGAPKAAIAAAAGVPLSESFAQNPASLLDAQAAAGVKGTATLEWRNNRAIITYPIPGVAGATATATLDERFRAERVVVKHGSNTTEFEYGNYQDFNNPLHRIEAMYAGTIVERQNGTVVRDLRTVETEIGQVYVAIPVPASVRAAGPARN